MIRQGDYGTEVVLEVVDPAGAAIDISTATGQQAHFEKPDGSGLTKDTSFVTDGTDGQITCDLADGDVDQAGLWHLQAEITTPGGHWRTQPIAVPVHRAL